MELRKRSLTKDFTNNNYKYKLKKQKNDNSKRQSHIEDLSGEIWFELFAYFDGQSLINVFSQLNSYITSLLSDYRLPIHLNILCSNFQIPSLFNTNQIVSLTIDYSYINDDNQKLHINSFIRLRSLCLIYINDEQLEKVSQFPLNNLCQISIRAKCARFITKIISIYFPNVNRLILNSMEKEFLVKPFQHDKTKNRIEKLTLNGRIKLAKLFRLWSFVPNLRSLSLINGGVHQCDYWMDENIISHKNFPPNLSFMHINICDDDMSFSNLERLIPKSIRYLILSGSMADDDLNDYLSSTNWIRLISNCSNKLNYIKLNISSYYDPSDSTGLRKLLLDFRNNSFFHNTIIKSQNFFITINGYIKPDLNQ
ncbi:unnamed protein product [Adineta steineri]|uniref:Uncharacterized protein n=1 Tax=Adineta steineri TaxID=433720 RepID=A0A814KHR8_9BILA|nr:unnamed protein product [Adineta steineri]CAF1609742.1 unnamed protein product [Adineta steineri]